MTARSGIVLYMLQAENLGILLYLLFTEQLLGAHTVIYMLHLISSMMCFLSLLTSLKLSVFDDLWPLTISVSGSSLDIVVVVAQHEFGHF